MKVEAIRQCDAQTKEGRKALFPGQRYDLPPDVARLLIAGGHIRAIVTESHEGPAVAAPQTVRAQGRPRGER